MDSLIDMMDKVTIVFGFVTMLGVFYNIWQNRRNKKLENQKIKIYLDL